MRKIIAITEIWSGSGRMVNSGRFDAEGNPILRVETVITEVGTVFDVSDEEAEKLIRNGAAAPAEDHDKHWCNRAPEQTEGGN